MLISQKNEIADKLSSELQNQKELIQDIHNDLILFQSNFQRIEKELKKLMENL